MAIAVSPIHAQVTESPSTVAPGAWLIEADLMSVTFHRESAAQGITSRSKTVISAAFLTTGVAPSIDVQLGTEFFHRDRIDIGGVRAVASGRGDTYVRAKWTVMGDESEGPSLAVLPWVKFPTADDGVGNDETDWGVIVPLGMPGPGGGTLNAMVEVARPSDGAGGRETTWFLSASFLRPLAARWEWYAEMTAGFVDLGNSDSTATAGGGLRWGAGESMIVDLGLAVGLTDISPDWNPVIRLEWSF